MTPEPAMPEEIYAHQDKTWEFFPCEECQGEKFIRSAFATAREAALMEVIADLADALKCKKFKWIVFALQAAKNKHAAIITEAQARAGRKA